MRKITRTKSIEIRLTDDELNALHQAKGSQGTLARYAREKLLSDTTYVERQQTISQYTELIFQLKKIGTNINQIAYQLNKYDISKVEAIVALRQELKNIRALADEKVDEVIK
ncbi:plasmid mobilization relaxosome protein MobC [Acidovorax sp. CCYZU-2555]|uniref:plasmid mobilization relaxosome protein MobC n=1 Tax=Acidovorax sp. CCYZU-2555 TaxID=2835042 RepID=UPI001BD008BE|nr:plasmid mobilization relaxosome protein MobC [Acidovorax sp. CCYZU-2555]MBS7776919.1 plasmid mobilization relaxosome protein MobC [Acidovorax sp. CCYZU-2555]